MPMRSEKRATGDLAEAIAGRARVRSKRTGMKVSNAASVGRQVAAGNKRYTPPRPRSH